mmetsp:Transcript_29456/g.57686  ORF Transcript_29456/g.57686 Transcript_29456/m.57686 type:complete len:506 (+) Transcript_29456:69-1586(+)
MAAFGLAVFLSFLLYVSMSHRNNNNGLVLESDGAAGNAPLSAMADISVNTKGVMALFDRIFMILNMPIVKGCNSGYQFISAARVGSAMRQESSYQLDNQRQLLEVMEATEVSNLSVRDDVLDSMTLESEVATLKAAFDYNKSLHAFLSAGVLERNVLETNLDASTAPSETSTCEMRFNVAQQALDAAYCEAVCKKGSRSNKCMEVLKRDVSNLIDLTELMKVRCKLWMGYPQGMRDNKTWHRFTLGSIVSALEGVSSGFAAPFSLAIVAQAQLVNFAKMLEECCVAGSHWLNPLGNFASMARSFASGKTKASISDMNHEKLKQFRRYIHKATCPAIQAALCNAGCPGQGLACQAKARQSENADSATSALTRLFYDKYCHEMTSFYKSFEIVCDNTDASFQTVPKFTAALNLVFDASSIQGMAALAFMMCAWPDPSIMVSLDNVLLVASALSSASFLLKRMTDGWNTASEQCQEIARAAFGLPTSMGRSETPSQRVTDIDTCPGSI